MNEAELQIAKSGDAFANIVWPQIEQQCGGGNILQVEGVKEKIASVLDCSCGIDFLQITQDGARGIASRVQYGATNYETFTIRTKLKTNFETEFTKRLRGMENSNYLTPYMTVQAYINKGTLLGAAVIVTEQLYSYINFEGVHKFECKNNPDGNQFIYITWQELINAGITFMAKFPSA